MPLKRGLILPHLKENSGDFTQDFIPFKFLYLYYYFIERVQIGVKTRKLRKAEVKTSHGHNKKCFNASPKNPQNRPLHVTFPPTALLRTPGFSAATTWSLPPLGWC
jgi:hypothetical protein